jgi:hypothetical protein
VARRCRTGKAVSSSKTRHSALGRAGETRAGPFGLVAVGEGTGQERAAAGPVAAEPGHAREHLAMGSTQLAPSRSALLAAGHDAELDHPVTAARRLDRQGR